MTAVKSAAVLSDGRTYLATLELDAGREKGEMTHLSWCQFFNPVCLRITGWSERII